MVRAVTRPALLLVAVTAACGGRTASIAPDAPADRGPAVPTANPMRGISATRLSFDVTTLAATSSITFEPSASEGATLEVGDLMIDTVSVPFTSNTAAKTIDVAVAAGDAPATIEIAFHYKNHMGFAGASAAGYTFLWPYYCGNLFPCHSEPRDGLAMTLSVTGVPAGKLAVFPTAIPAYR